MDVFKAGDESIELGMQLMEKSEEEVIGYIGYLDGEQSAYRLWQGKGITAPQWDEGERWLEFTSGVERGAVKDWLQSGSDFLKEKALPEIKVALCENGECRKEIQALESDVRELLKYLVGLIGGLLTVSVPAAAVSISVAVAVFLVKKGLRSFCRG
jgi:hypothetical protein